MTPMFLGGVVKTVRGWSLLQVITARRVGKVGSTTPLSWHNGSPLSATAWKSKIPAPQERSAATCTPCLV